MSAEPTPEFKEAVDLTISRFVGYAEGRFEMLLRDAYNGARKPLYR